MGVNAFIGQYLWIVLILVASSVYADVIVKTQNETVTYFVDEMAAFGPSVPDEGITGYIWNVNPSNACSEVAPPPDNTSIWIALIERNNCTFVEKVRNVQRPGYRVAIVYNSEGDNDIARMSGDQNQYTTIDIYNSHIAISVKSENKILFDDVENFEQVRNVQKWFAAAIVYNSKKDDEIKRMHGDSSGIKIPSVFIGWSNGMALHKSYCYNCTDLDREKGYYKVTVDNKELNYNPYLLWPFAVVVGTCFVLMLVFMLVKCCRDIRKKKKSRLSTKHLKKIPTKKFKKGDEYDVCAICLDDYEEGEKLRLLPCSHVYHTKCIDPWLTKNKRSCPICKRKVIPGADPDDSDSDSSDDEGPAPSERTPLLGGSGTSGTSNRRSTFDNSGLPAAQVSHVNEGHGHTGNTDSDHSDSEMGAVGGAAHVRLAKENPMVPLGPPEEAEEATSNAVIETRQSADNEGRMIEGEGEKKDDNDAECNYVVDEEVVFSEAGKKDEKKSNGVI